LCGSVPHAELDERVDAVLDQIARTGPVARAAVKRELNQRLPTADVGLFFARSARRRCRGDAGVRREASTGLAR